ncbi:hypothetical protein SCLCIDRAFT_1218054 [Scleroderma citrinum Foug A]|uniref:Uncharacterized protein n=1 Tax=Scleroderma citrinum Foug A TaxID=1036808 RepID=A0A0C3DSQ9_9AGAM|nr:hypothetical protein SCLCIDRAFT_1218054 [Scleroderma citrinum Foug A]
MGGTQRRFSHAQLLTLMHMIHSDAIWGDRLVNTQIRSSVAFIPGRQYLQNYPRKWAVRSTLRLEGHAVGHLLTPFFLGLADRLITW